MLQINDLSTSYYRNGARLDAVRSIDLAVPTGSMVALVGESGSGKSTVARSILRQIDLPTGEIRAGTIFLDGVDLLRLDRATMRRQLLERIGFVPQDPSTALDPLFKVRSQVHDVVRHLPRSDRDSVVEALFDRLGIEPAKARMRDYPHQFSGGMQQRVAIAIALAKSPDLLIADEPTTALDVTTQLSILGLLDELCRHDGLTTLLVTHDLSIARLVCRSVAVMYGGIIVESGPTADVLAAPEHPYTRALLEASLDDVAPRTRLRAVAGQSPRLDELPPGCPFAPRCPHATIECHDAVPVSRRVGDVEVRCIKAGEL